MNPPEDEKASCWGEGEIKCGQRVLMSSGLNYTPVLLVDILQKCHHSIYVVCLKFTNIEVSAIHIDLQLT